MLTTLVRPIGVLFRQQKSSIGNTNESKTAGGEQRNSDGESTATKIRILAMKMTAKVHPRKSMYLQRK